MGESKETDILIQAIRGQKQAFEVEIEQKREKILVDIERKGMLNHELANCLKQKSEVEKRIRLNSNLQKKDDVATRLIAELNAFIQRMKEEKKASLEQRILEGLQRLMHKQQFVSKVKVEVAYDITDILLFDQQGEEIQKEDLSKGEQQLYATSILKALVEESNINFPVFIDSPLQKFDAQHAENIIKDFYPYISKQVVILPLLNKEISQQEYQQMLPNVVSTFLIENIADGVSHFKQVKPEQLFEEAKLSVFKGTHV